MLKHTYSLQNKDVIAKRQLYVGCLLFQFSFSIPASAYECLLEERVNTEFDWKVMEYLKVSNKSCRLTCVHCWTVISVGNIGMIQHNRTPSHKRIVFIVFLVLLSFCSLLFYIYCVFYTK